MKIVAIPEQATDPLGQLDADGCLAATAYANKDDDHGVSGYEQADKHRHHEADQRKQRGCHGPCSESLWHSQTEVTIDQPESRVINMGSD